MRLSRSLVASIPVLALGTLALGCVKAGLEPPPEPPRSQVAQDTVIELDRSECYGNCPVYRVTIFGDGNVVIDTTKARRRENHIQGLEAIALADEIEQRGFFDLQEQPACASDKPRAKITVKHHGKTKTFSHAIGCPPDEAEAVVTRIDTVARSDKWAW
jgi:hypothetical protein